MIRKLILLVIFGLMSFVTNAKTLEFQEKNMRQIFVLHGYSASINDHWFLDLKHQIEDENTTVPLIPLSCDFAVKGKTDRKAIISRIILFSR